MTKSYQNFIEHTGSTLTKKGALLNECFDTYQFSSDYGKGYTALYQLDSYANICIAEHSYTRDFEYSVPTEDSISIQQYDSIDSDRRYPQGNVLTGMQYIGYAPGNQTCRYVIKKKRSGKGDQCSAVAGLLRNISQKRVRYERYRLKKRPTGFSTRCCNS